MSPKEREAFEAMQGILRLLIQRFAVEIKDKGEDVVFPGRASFDSMTAALALAETIQAGKEEPCSE